MAQIYLYLMIQNRAGVSTKVAGLVFFVGLYFIGIGYLLSGAETTRLLPMLYWNRVYFYIILGGVLIGTYAWMNFKPKRLNTQQYTYHTYDKEDIPDSLRENLHWGSGRYVNRETLAEGEEPTEPSPDYWKKKRKEYQ